MKNRLPILTVLACFVISGSVLAQEKPVPAVYTLEQCIEYAKKNNISSVNAGLDEDIAKAKVKETIGIGLPQVSGSASINHNEKLRRFFTTYDQDGGFIDLSGVPGIQDGDVVAAQNFFQLKSSGDAGININQIIFNGSYVVGLQASQAFKDLAYKNANLTEEQLVQGVMKAYYAVLINKERTELFTSNIARVDSLFRSTKAMYENGFAESIDADRIQVTLNNLITERDKFINLNEIGIQLLKFQMNYPMNEPLDVAGNIQDVQVNVNMDSYRQDWDYKSRPDYQVLEANQRLQELNVRNQYARTMPVLTAFANLGYTTQSPNVGGIFKTNSGIADANGVGPDKWYGYSMFGVSLNIPIFTGLQQTYKIQQEKLSLQKINNSFIELKSGIDLDVTKSTLQFENAVRTLTSQQQNMDLADRVARITKIKYEQGVGSNLEVVDAEDALRQAQTNYYGALFDAMIAKVDLDKAYGKLLTIERK
ncbi:MAG: TolC family protein [Cyclobacteriaceae bacterium]